MKAGVEKQETRQLRSKSKEVGGLFFGREKLQDQFAAFGRLIQPG
jgi:hypothetical protein